MKPTCRPCSTNNLAAERLKAIPWQHSCGVHRVGIRSVPSVHLPGQFSIGANEAAQYLRISRALLYQMICQGRIKPVKIDTRTIVRGAELKRFLYQQHTA